MKNNNNQIKFNVLSLFDGMSCGQIALNKMDIKINNYYASEIDKYAIAVTQKNYPNTIQLGNVCKIQAKDLSKIDLLLGGSPCQGFSFAGNGLNFNDPRSKLFFEYTRLLKETNPKWFLFENVIMKKEYQDVITKLIGVAPIIIDSALVSAQSRKRLYWTNILGIQQPRDKKLCLGDILENNVDKKYNITERFYKKNIGTLSYTKSRYNIRKLSQKAKTLTTGGHGISNSGSTNIWFSDNFIRIPTPLECERLQTVPEGYTNIGISDSKRYYMLGNGWTIDIITHILSFIKIQMEGINDREQW